MVTPSSPAIMSIAPDSRLASKAAVFSMIRTVIRSKAGAAPHQVSFGASTMCAPETTSTILYGPNASPGLAGSVSKAVRLR